MKFISATSVIFFEFFYTKEFTAPRVVFSFQSGLFEVFQTVFVVDARPDDSLRCLVVLPDFRRVDFFLKLSPPRSRYQSAQLTPTLLREADRYILRLFMTCCDPIMPYQSFLIAIHQGSFLPDRITANLNQISKKWKRSITNGYDWLIEMIRTLWDHVWRISKFKLIGKLIFSGVKPEKYHLIKYGVFLSPNVLKVEKIEMFRKSDSLQVSKRQVWILRKFLIASHWPSMRRQMDIFLRILRISVHDFITQNPFHLAKILFSSWHDYSPVRLVFVFINFAIHFSFRAVFLLPSGG
jgi:hypothetical protein